MRSKKISVRSQKKGRPWTDDLLAKRKQISAKIRADLARDLHASAQIHGRTVSTEIEHWFEELATYRKIIGLIETAHIEQLQTVLENFAQTHPELFKNDR